MLTSEKCKELNFLYTSLLKIMKVSESNLKDINCSGNNCLFDILIKFKQDSTEFLLYQNINNKLETIRTFTLTPSVNNIPINNKKFEELEKEELNNFMAAYTYQSLMKLLILIPASSNHNFMVTAEGEYFNNFEEESKKRFIRSILSLQNVDDRIIIDWSNVRVINSNEKKIQDFVVMKSLLDKNSDTKGESTADKSVVSLNFSSGGLNVIGLGANTKADTPQTQSSKNIDTLLNPVQTESDSIQIQSGGEKQNLYQKEIKLLGMQNIENSLLGTLGGNSPNRLNYNDNVGKNYYEYNTFSNINKGDYYNKPFFKSVDFKNDNKFEEDTGNIFKEKVNNSTKLPGDNEETFENSSKQDGKYKKFLNDPTIKRLQKSLEHNEVFKNYLKNSINNNHVKLNSYSTNINKKNETKYVKTGNFRFTQSKSKIMLGGKKSHEEKVNFNITNAEIKLITLPNIKDFNKTLTEKTKINSDPHSFNYNPCFNLGYSDNQLKLIGTGNYTECYNFIKNDLELSKKMNKTQFLNNLNKNLTEITLDKEFKNFKFLFYENKVDGLNISDAINYYDISPTKNYEFNEKIEYSQLKKKIQKICSLQFSHILAEYSKFTSKDLHKLCFDMTYMTYLLDQNEIDENKYLVVKAHSNRKNATPFKNEIYEILFSEKIRVVFYIFLILTMILNLWSLFQDKIKKYLIYLLTKCSENNFRLNNRTIEEFLSYYKVKAYLFYEDDCYFVKKYGKNFDFQDYLEKNQKGLFNEIKEVYRQDEGLKKRIDECRVYFVEFKVSMMSYLITIILIILMLTNTIILLIGIHDLNPNENWLINSSTLIIFAITILSALVTSGVGRNSRGYSPNLKKNLEAEEEERIQLNEK
jgi:hypothetical protein